jgi:hypothetical protein
VEALSVTPFSARALDRGLSGVLVALMRLWDARLNGNLKAGELKDDDPRMPKVFDQLEQRSANATHDPIVAQRMADQLVKRREEWLHRVHNQKDHRLAYKSEGGATVGLLAHAATNDWEMFTCLDSLRDVEGTTDLILDQRSTGLTAE